MKSFGLAALVAVFSTTLQTALSSPTTTSCKCIPGDPCWPSNSQFQRLNSTLGGKLIKDKQPAKVCYPGPDYDEEACTVVRENDGNSTFLADTSIGLCYPVDRSTCPPIPPGSKGGTCRMGRAPIYTVNATSPLDVAKGIKFAKDHNLRLVIRNTGHDILGRSTGAGSLQVWMRYIRTGVDYQKTYKPSDGCAKSGWKGGAIKIGGGYVWADVYKVSAANKQIVVGGGDPSVGCIGGWMQGGGHSPATRDFGLGADQVLEAEVVLADGRVVTANECQNSDLFFAIRGGGPGTYGVVTSTTVKTYPEKKVVSQSFAFAPLSKSKRDMDRFMDAVTDVYAAYPDLSDNGYSGFGTWAVASPTPFFANYTVGFTHIIAKFDTTMAEAQRVAQPYVEQISKYNGTSLFVSSSYSSFPSYNAFYVAKSGVQQKTGVSSALASRLLDREGLTGNRTALKRALKTVAGSPEEYTSNNVVFQGGGAVKKSDPASAVLPAWRKAYVHHIIARGWAPGSTDAIINAVHHDVTYNKVEALRELVPDSGSYMNEGDRRNPVYPRDFYGSNLERLLAIKEKYDPDSVFYCKTCVGSGSWHSRNGHLCRSR